MALPVASLPQVISRHPDLGQLPGASAETMATTVATRSKLLCHRLGRNPDDVEQFVGPRMALGSLA